MYIGLFKKPYTLRKHSPQKVVDGYAEAKHKDITANLNVQPQAPDKLDAAPEGERTVKHLKAWGPSELASADEYTGTPGDYLFYHGIWYECVSCVYWDHTILTHYQSDFVALPANKQPDPPRTRRKRR